MACCRVNFSFTIRLLSQEVNKNEMNLYALKYYISSGVVVIIIIVVIVVIISSCSS